MSYYTQPTYAREGVEIPERIKLGLRNGMDLEDDGSYSFLKFKELKWHYNGKKCKKCGKPCPYTPAWRECPECGGDMVNNYYSTKKKERVFITEELLRFLDRVTNWKMNEDSRNYWLRKKVNS